MQAGAVPVLIRINHFVFRRPAMRVRKNPQRRFAHFDPITRTVHCDRAGII